MFESDLSERIVFGDPPAAPAKSSQNSSVITVCGSGDGLAAVQEPLIRDIAAISISWIRASGPEKQVHCRVQFQRVRGPVSASVTYHGLGTSPIDPVLHSYWVDSSVFGVMIERRMYCWYRKQFMKRILFQNMDAFKYSIKPQLTTWMEELHRLHVGNWVIVVLVSPDQKPLRSRVTPRLDVYEKIKTEFCSKSGDHGRCVFLMDPRSGMGDADAWYNCVAQFRQLIFESYETKLRTLEERSRLLRESKNSSDWRFSDYFDLQIALTRCYEKLGFREEALLRLDETSFMVSTLISEGSLNHYAMVLTTDWMGINLVRRLKGHRQLLDSKIEVDFMSMLDIRTFLFVYQYELLRELGLEVEIIDRAVSFIQDANLDTKILKVSMMPGAIFCWNLLTCNEMRQMCQGGGDGVSFPDLQSLATLLDLERNMLEQTGRLCGLMPGQTSTPEHRVLLDELTKAIESSVVSTAILRLFETLSSVEKFTKAYLELSEMTMGTFKHVGRVRTVKLLGVELAKFYMKLAQYEKAMGFLLDALKFFRSEHWSIACGDVAELYLQCAEASSQWDAVLRGSMLFTACRAMDLKRREKHFVTIKDLAARSSNESGLSSSMPIPWPDAFVVTVAGSLPEQVITQQPFDVVLQLDCYLPSTVTMQEIRLVLEPAASVTSLGSRSPVPAEDSVLFNRNKHGVKEKHLLCSSTVQNDLDNNPNILKQFPGVKCVYPQPKLSDFNGDDYKDKDRLNAVCASTTIEPGRQLLMFPLQLPEVGEYYVRHVCLCLSETLTFVSPIETEHKIQVLTDETSCTLEPADGLQTVLWTNVVHSFDLTLEGIPTDMETVTTSIQPSEPAFLKVFNEETRSDSKTLTLSIKNARKEKFKILCSAPYPVYEAEVLVHLLWKNEPKKFLFRFKAPVEVACIVRTCMSPSPTIFVSSSMRNLLDSELHVTNAMLEYGNQLADALMKDHGKLIVIPPLAATTFLWKFVDVDSNAAEMIFRCTYSSSKKSASDAESAPTHKLQTSFQPGKFGQMRITIGFKADHREPVTVGDEVTLLYIVEAYKFPEGLTVFYQIHHDVNYWHSSESTSGSLNFAEGAQTKISSTVNPLKSGNTVFPCLRLFYLQDEEICPLDFFHVCNESAYQTVTIKGREILEKDQKLERIL